MSQGQGPPPDPDRGERTYELGLALLAAVVAVTCAASSHLEPPLAPHLAAAAPSTSSPSAPDRAPAPPPPSTSSSAVESAVPAASAASAATPRGPGAAPSVALAARMRALADGSSRAPLRIVWFGDSHTAADFLTDAVRARLFAAYPAGGPGFIRLGLDPYRHGRVRVRTQGRWRKQPPAPAQEARSGDGVFGLGGIRLVPVSADARVRLELPAGAVRGEARYDLALRFGAAGASFTVSVDGATPTEVSGREGSGPAIRHVELRGREDGTLELGRFIGPVELFGATIEGSEPGIVLDTLGIDGARAATVLAWDEATWGAELARREPALVVLAFGTNEAFADRDPERYAAHYRALLARIRQVAPAADCLLVGPTDAQAGSEVASRILAIDALEARVASELGCGYFSLQQAMGGPGGFRAWLVASPPLAADDGVHLAQAGYARLGDRIGRQLLGEE